MPLGGVPVPAHVDKSSYSVISSLGMIPPELGAKTVEVSPNGIQRGFVLPERENYLVITDSDAHALETMSMHTRLYHRTAGTFGRSGAGLSAQRRRVNL